MGNVVLNKQKKNREGTLEWDNLGKVNSKGQKPKIIGIYYRDDVLEYQLIAENVDLCCEYEVDMVGRMS